MPPKGKPPAKKGPPAAALAKLKAQVELTKKLEEEEKRLEEEQRRQFEEEERLRKIDEKIKEEENKLRNIEKKKNEKVSKEEMKKQEQMERVRRMIEAGMIIPGLDASGKPQPKKVEQPKPKPKAVQHVDPQPAAADEAGDDWEAEFDREQEALAKKAEAEAAEETEYVDTEEMHLGDLRCPICCVLGHVDTGKTSLLDKIRRTNVASGEAGRITQQIGATFFPAEAILSKTEGLIAKHSGEGKKAFELKVPGLLIIDTPGHESFSNLRSRGSNLCDISVLVVNLVKGLEKQTRESIGLLKSRNCPFIVALNQVDRLYGWESTKDLDIESSLAKQKPYVIQEYESKIADVTRQFAEEGLNAALYYKNTDIKKYVSMVPTSAITGEGIADLLLLKVQLVQRFMESRISFTDELKCTVLEVKKVEGLGTTIDVILVNGSLAEGQTICICGMGGPIITQIRALLTPPPMRESRVKSEFVHHKKIYAAKGLKIVASDLEDAVPGTPLFVLDGTTDVEQVKKEVMKDLSSIFASVDKAGKGVAVQASTLGSLEALLTFLKESKIPVSTVAVGPVHKRHIITASANAERNKKFAVMLVFDVEVTKDAQHLADKNGIRILSADVIYHLFDQFTAYVENYEEEQRKKNQERAVFPCQLKILECFRQKDPIILGCTVEKGSLRIGTPLSTFEKGKKQYLGKVAGIERDNKELTVAKKGSDVSVKIVGDSSVTFGRHFTEASEIYSEITRDSIDALKLCFKDQVDTEEWLFIRDVLKKKFGVM